MTSASVAQKKKLLRGTTVYGYSVSDDIVPVGQYTKYKIIKPKKVTITDNGGYLIIKDNPDADKTHYQEVSGKSKVKLLKEVPSWKHESKKSAYFLESEDDSKTKFWFEERKVVLQAISIPLKIRSRVNANGSYAAIPSNTETGVNIGFLAGPRISWNRFRPTTNIFGQQTAKYSVTGGLFLGTGAADLSTTLTRPVITTGRKAPMISFGFSIVLGFNSFNIGYSCGWDHAVGPDASSWVFQGKMWNGIVVALDLIK